MDAPPHRLGLERAVEVYSGHDALVGVTGSGYVLGPDLVLTSGAVVDPGTPCQVRAPWSARWTDAEQVWRGGGGADAVLLRVPQAPWAALPGVEHNRWARVTGRRPLHCVARGFPRAAQRAGFRDAETVSGLVDIPAGAVSKALTVGVLRPDLAATPTSLWQGLPGAVLLAEPAGQIIGVVAASPDGYAQRRLDAIPVTALLGDQRFRELAGVAPGPLEAVAEGDPSTSLPDLLTFAREDLPQDCADWALLMARHAVVPFLGRTGELAELRSWAADPAALSIAIVTGRGGTGKTRLAGELCAELAEAGWDTGFLPPESIGAPLSARGVSLDALRPTLLVADRPEPSSPLLGELIRRLAKHGRNPRVRLLLLVREPGEPEWWRRLDTAAGGWLRRLNTTTVQLNTAPLTLSERAEHAITAMTAFAPSRAALPAPPRLDDPDYGLPLHVHTAALLRLRDGGAEPGGGLLERFVSRECDQWVRVWPGDRERLGAVAARQAVAVLTLTAPTPAELPGLLTAVPAIRGRAVDAMDVAGWLGRIFPGEGRLTPLGPDLVAERFLAGTEDLDALVLALHDHESRTAGHLVRMLDVLRLSAGDERVRSALWSLLASRIGKLVTQAMANPGSRLGDVLDAALGLFTTDRRIAEAVSEAVPVAVSTHGAAWEPHGNAALGLRALNVTLGELAVRHRRAGEARTPLAGALSRLSDALAAVGRVGEAVVAAAESVEVYAAAPPYEEAAGRARALFGLGACLLLAGEAGSALKPAQEAAARFRILAEEDPRYAAEAARAHHNVACALLEVGRSGEAVAAFEAAGGDAGFAADLAGILSVLPRPGSRQRPAAPAARKPRPPFAIQRPEPAATAFSPAPGIQASESRAPGIQASGSHAPESQVPGSRMPGSRAFGSQVPGSHAPGRPLRMPLAAPVPESPAVPAPGPLVSYEEADDGALPELAGCLAVAATAAVKYAAPTSRDVAHRLHRLATWLEANGRPADALVPAAEAVTRLRALAGEEPGLRAMLASAAALPARLHARLDDLDAAQRSAAEAVRNLRALVTLEPDEHRAALAGQLLDLGELLLIDDRPDAALDPLQEAMAVAAEGHTAAQARGRRLLGLCLAELGRAADGRTQLELAAELYDVLRAEDDARSEVRARLRRWEAAAGPADGRPWLLTMVVVRPDEAVTRAEAQLAECRKNVRSGEGGLGREQVDAYLSAQAMLAGALADAGQAGKGFGLAMQAAELLQRHATPAGPHALAVGMVAAALGRSLVGLGRHKEAIPHLLTAIESYEPHSGTSLVFRTELAELLILETVSLADAACPADAEAAADRLVELYARLVSERLEAPLALAGALRLQAGIRFTRRNPQGARQSVTRALDLLPPEPEHEEHTRLLAATCLELAGLCLAELGDDDAAGEKLAAGTAMMARIGAVPYDLVPVHLLALVRLARLRTGGERVALCAQILGMRPLPGTEVLETVVEELSEHVDTVAAAELVPSLTAFTEALEREVPLSGAPRLHDRYGRCLARFGATAARAGDTDGAVAGAELAARVYRGLAAVSSTYRGPLGSALAALARLRPDDPALLEQAIDLLGGQQDPALAEILHLYAAELLERGRPVEALAQCERAADLCDELDDPAVAAAIYAQLGSTLAALDRPQAALEAITWSLAELDRGDQDREVQDREVQDREVQDREGQGRSGQDRDQQDRSGQEQSDQDRGRRDRSEKSARVRAQAVQVRGRVLRAFGRDQEALAHLVEALRLFTRLPDPPAAAETAAMIADDLLAAGRPQEAAEYAAIAMTGHEPGTVKHALATQRLVRCHMMRGELAEANALVDDLIPRARRSPDDLTYRAILADSLAQSSELLPLLRLDGGTQAEARAREAIAIYDELLTTGMDAQALHTSRAGACLTLASALRMRELAAEAIQPLREAVAALERFSPGNPMQAGLLSRAMLMLGDALMEAGRALEAGLVFHRGTQVTRDELSRAVAHARLGFCQRELGRNDAADAALRASAGLLRGLLADRRKAEPGTGPGPASGPKPGPGPGPDAEPGAEPDAELTGLLLDVLRGRVKVLEQAGRDDDARAVQDELRRLSGR
ncbi:hypothetical protein [Nonomuraea sp. NPDC050643]|uniref:hypothetical protein n=1 Tax=Nonomuraea sp. NPDC050643 TaxID=3155660 RepID=UPI003402AE3C